MRGRKKQNQKIWSVKVDKKPILIDGKNTGEKYDAYSKPVLYQCSVSATAGTPQEIGAGIVPDYDREVTVYNKHKIQFTENELLFVDNIPQVDDSGELKLKEEFGEPVTKPDYLVKKVIDTQVGLVARYGISKRV